MTEPTVCEGEHEMRFGPRSYTSEQARLIAEAVADRQALPGEPLIEDDLPDD